MQLLLLTVGLALICGLQAQEGNHEEPQGGLEELSGRWHSVALASNKSDLIRPWGHFRVFIHSMSAKDGNLHGDILIPWVQGTKGRGGAVELQGGWGWPW
ncbi:minor allergen Can f 2-like [Lycaon pictus]